MLRKVVLIISIIFIVCILIAYLIINVYLLKADTIFAQKFSQVMNSYDMTEIDKYFSNDTVFVCNGRSGTYADLKNNIANACNGKNFVFSSYGNGNNKFANNYQKVHVVVFGTYDNNNIGEGLIELTLKKSGLFKITIKSVKCDDSFFEAIFFSGLK